MFERSSKKGHLGLATFIAADTSSASMPDNLAVQQS